MDTTTDSTANSGRLAMTSAERSKLAAVAAGATANATDAQLRDRSTHTGTQAISTVDGLQSALNGKLSTTATAPVLVIAKNGTVPGGTAVGTVIVELAS